MIYEKRDSGLGYEQWWWTIGGVTHLRNDWARHYGVEPKTVANRWEKLLRTTYPEDVTEAQLLKILNKKLRKPGPVSGWKKYNEARKSRAAFVYQLEHLLALGAPVAIRAEYARRLAGG